MENNEEFKETEKSEIVEKPKENKKKKIEITFFNREVQRVPVVVKFKRKDGSVVEVKGFKVVVLPKKIVIRRKKNDN
jgi:hypothetical protein